MTTNSSASSFPKLVMIIRHGEKPGPSGDEGTPSADLSFRGSARAAALPSLFSPDPTGSGTPEQQLSCNVAASSSSQFSGTYQSPKGVTAPAPRFPSPQHIVATEASDSSNRPVETVTPTAQALGLKIHSDHKDKDYDKVAADITTKFAGDIVLVCWHHGNIPEMAATFGVPQTQITKALNGGSKWAPTVFDRVWSIDWDTGSANLTPGYQQLLFGDQKGHD
jgi:hypothetical protein